MVSHLSCLDSYATLKYLKKEWESLNSLGLREHIHQPLCNTCKITKTHTHVPKELRLATDIKAMNDTLGPEGFAPSALVFGEYPQIRAPEIGNLSRPDLAERAKIAGEARKKRCQVRWPALDLDVRYGIKFLNFLNQFANQETSF